MSFDKLVEYINRVEQVYFFGAYSEDTVRKDLQLRKNMDVRGGWQSNNLREKQSVYIEHFNSVLGDINFVINQVGTNRPNDSTFISRCERCKNQVNNLLEVVRSF